MTGDSRMQNFSIRKAEEKDAPEICAIYRWYVENTSVTFSTQAPTEDECRKSICEIQKMYPYFVALSSDGKIIGFVYGHQLRPHEAYKWNVEATIYLSHQAPMRQGIGSALYKKFIETLSRQGFKYVYGVITSGNKASLEMHKKLGFQEIGKFPNAGNKAGKWQDIVWMQKQLGEATENPPEPLPFSMLSK
ncbi:GNAT family N-acetyltransferase [Treponema sp.]|uniref:GNAT family N-acetyltransferase n=1 Tax=Treponema sp. TaxID=166 RepID=UPI003F0B63BB